MHNRAIAILSTLLLVLTLILPLAYAQEGTIGNAVTDTYEFDATNGENPGMISIGGNIYAIAYRGASDSGWIRTYTISQAGVITKSPIDSLNFETGTSVLDINPVICKVGEGYYAIVYTGVDGDGWIRTVSIDSNGNIGNSVIDSLEFDAADGLEPDIIRLGTGSYYAIPYRGGSFDGFICTVNIDSTGNIGATVTDSWEYDAADGRFPSICAVNGNGVYAIAYYKGGVGQIITLTLNSSTGAITKSTIDSVQFDASVTNSLMHIIKILGGTHYAIAFSGSGTDGYISTISITSAGDIAAAITETYEFDTTNGAYMDFDWVSGIVYIVAYTGSGSDGYLKTINITAAGDIAASVIDTLDFDISNAQDFSLCKLYNDYYAVAYQGESLDGYLITATVETWLRPNQPPTFTATTYNRTRIDLSWTKGTQADYTHIVAKLGSYPTSRTDGTNIYNSTGTSYSHTGLNPSEHWYYRAWGWNNTDRLYSDSYSSADATTNSNTPPNYGTPTPTNNSINQNTTLTWGIPINDANGDTFNWWINCSNGNTSTASGATNGTKQLSISGLSYSTNYKVWVNATDSYGWTRAWYNFTTKAEPPSNNPPTAPDPLSIYPVNGSTNIERQPTISLWANDTDGDQLTVTFYSSTNGIDWEYQEQQTYVTANTTLYWEYTDASGYGTLYYWKVVIDDGIDDVSAIFHFTTEESEPIVTEPSTGEQLIYPYTLLFRPDGDTGYNNWQRNTGTDAHYTYVNETTPDYSIRYLYAPTSVPDEWYTLPNHTTQIEPIANITIYVCAKTNTGSPQIQIHAINGTLEYGDYSDYIDTTATWTNYSYTFTHPPADERAWTWTDIDNLWIGFGKIAPGNVSVTQCYAVVNYGNPYIKFPFNFSINATEPTGKPMNITFRTNASGAWEDIEDANYTDAGNGTYYAQANLINEYNTTYWWSVNISTSTGWFNTTYSFTTEPAPNKVPFVDKDFYPGTKSIGVPVPIRCRASIHDDEMNIMTIHWMTNASGTWEEFGLNASATNGTYYQDFPYSEHGKQYWWSINISNEGHWSNTTNTFITEEQLPSQWYDSNYSWVKRIDINHSKFTENLSYFPLLIHIIDANFTHSQIDGDDFIFVANDNTTTLSYEFESYNYTTHELLVWVNIPFISCTTDTPIWLYWGNSTCSAHQNIEGTWNEDYVLVHHYTNGSLLDSTAYNHDGTNDDTSYSANGQIGGCRQGYDVIGGASTKIQVNSFTTLQTYITAEMWVYVDTGTANTNIRFYQEGPKVNTNDWAFSTDTTSTTRGLIFRVNGQYALRTGNGLNHQGYWYYVAGRVDISAQGDYVDILRNTTKEGYTKFLQNINNNYNTLYIGGDPNSAVSSWAGYFDEARISKVPRSWAWLNNSYDNANNPDPYIITYNATTLDDTMFINVTPATLDFGTVFIGETTQTNNYHFNLTNLGIRCNIDIESGDSNNWTYANYAAIGHNKFSMNYSDDDWSTETNIDDNGLNIGMHIERYTIIPFDLKLIMPTSSSTIDGQEYLITFIITAD